MPGNWLARKAGEPRGGRDAALRGARKLLEQELLSVPLEQAAGIELKKVNGIDVMANETHGVEIETDSDVE